MLFKTGVIPKLALLAFITAPLAAKASETGPSPLVIREATLFDSVKGVMLPHRTIVIVAGRIQAIGSPQQRVKMPAGARVLGARGKYVIPGLIDAHVHLALVLDFVYLTGDEILPLFLANGVTSVRDAGAGKKLAGRCCASRG